MVPQTPSSIPLNELLALARELQEFFVSQGWAFCFIGGLVVQTWGEPRYTKAVDITLLTGFGTEEPFIDALLARYRSRRPDARNFALVNRVLLLQSENGIGIDIAMGALDFDLKNPPPDARNRWKYIQAFRCGSAPPKTSSS